MSWFSNQWNKFNSTLNGDGARGADGGQSSGVIRRVEVVWGRERMQIVLPKLTTPVTLGHLKQEISSITSIPYEQVKLIHSGLILKDDRSALAAYGIREGSRLILVGTAGGARSEGDKVGAKAPALGPLSVGEQKARAKKQKEADTSEEGLMARIDEALAESRTNLFPEVELFERSVKALPASVEGADGSPAPIPDAAAEAAAPGATPTSHGADAGATNEGGSAKLMTPAEIANSHRKTSEMLLRQLLALDGVQVNSDTTRAARKQGVRDVQSHLDRLDAAWSEAKAKGVRPPA
ncbi:uncharacterized protein PFL1_01406 [Pseudozyma flocculosa PF-1]|uniref:Uncharacterized protein n=1 Tax=Pseudozyma flocculosa TaxID=84751 RepID=A0A5C3EWY1_9BASI|nr:uncharacterized protein PFL1_01406 [Pseudozyma flocculosa PF-1]EPQ31220.1 hypothetical protein PFL1_01406 [Pseudozyma flocculosa PF-1]SPO36285.1 uncharacterized protein PSFLO_01756 [Pseudozyma flocculosa]